MIIKNSIRLFLFTLATSFVLTQTSNAAFGTHQNIYIQGQPITKPAEIIGNIVTLRNLHVDHFIDHYRMFSPIVRQNIEYPNTISPIGVFTDLFNRMKRDENNETFRYSIFDNADNKLIGSIEIREKNNATYGQFACWINENYWGGGRFQEAAALISKAYFELTAATSYTAHVRPWNTRSRLALSNFGFRLIGAHQFENGTTNRHIFEYTRS